MDLWKRQKNRVVIASVLYLSTISYADTDTQYWNNFSKAKKLIEQNKVMEALPILQHLEQTQPNYLVEISLGDIHAQLGNSAQALSYFERAFQNAKNNNETIKRVALFKIARTQINLKNYQEAIDSYRILLTMNLSDEDKKIATVGLEEAQDKQAQLIDNSSLEISTGDAAALKNNPAEALNHYQVAYNKAVAANNLVNRRVALFKMARTQAWLEKYQDVINTYRLLLTMNLSDEDKNIALSGLKKAEEKQKQVLNNPALEVAKGDEAASKNDPTKALAHYTTSYMRAADQGNTLIQRVALFKIARTQIWLEKYQDAQDSYKKLLAMDLSFEDRARAEVGLKAAQGQIKAMDAGISSKEIALGDKAASEEKPVEALGYYELAYKRALSNQDPVMRRISLFKIARMQLWLKQYQKASNTYKKLNSMDLSSEDKKIVKEGLNKAFELQLGEDINQAIVFINQNNGQAAFKVIKSYLGKVKSFKLYLVAAQSMAIKENPQESLKYFNEAYQLSSNNKEKLLSLFGVIKMQLWLREPNSAAKTLSLLKQYHLGKQEKLQLHEHEHQLAQLIAKLRFESTVARAQQFLNMNAGRQAFEVIRVYLESGKFEIYMIASESMAILGNPERALHFYKLAFKASTNPSQKKAALFGIAKMQFWMAWYVRAKQTYRLLLQHYKLSPNEYQLALAGLVKSFAYYDRPQLAYKMIPGGLILEKPELVIAAAQASLWADWADITKNILDTYQPITSTIEPNSGLGRDLRDLEWQTRLATWPNVVTPSHFFSRDSETFTKKRELLNYKRYWNQQAETFVELDYRKYSQYQTFGLNATGFNVGQILRPTRHITLRGQIEPIEFNDTTAFQRNHWTPLLWSADSNYKPNDFVSLQLLTQKDVLETFPAFANEITTTQYATSLLVNPLPYVKLNGSLYKLNMSDTNSRNGYFTSASLLILPDLGLTATGVLREYSNKFRSPNYFSPHRYKEQKVLLKLGRRLGATWHYYLDGGLGRQYITPEPNDQTVSSPTIQWGMGINGPISKCLFFTAYYAHLRQASAFINSPDYTYQYGGISLNLLI
nr:tetratricopeptide repeat protein [Legionella jordanis]